MRSVDLKRAWVEARRLDDELLSTDKRFNRSVSLVHEDGSTFLIQSAFVELWIDPEPASTVHLGGPSHSTWVLVLSEHHEPLVYSQDEVQWIEYTSTQRMGGTSSGT